MVNIYQQRILEAASQPLHQIRAWIEQKQFSPEDLCSEVRHRVYQCCLHPSSEKPADPGLTGQTALSIFQNLYQSLLSNQAHLVCECGDRSAILKALFLSLGLRSRAVSLWTDENPNYDGNTITGHSLVEVFNPAKQNWELQDPYFDVYFADKTGIAVGLEKAVELGCENIFPRQGEKQGWDQIFNSHGSPIQVLKDQNYFKIYGYDDEGDNRPVIFIQLEDFPFYRLFETQYAGFSAPFFFYLKSPQMGDPEFRTYAKGKQNTLMDQFLSGLNIQFS